MPKQLFIFCLFVYLLPVSSDAQNLKAQINKTHLEASEILKLDLTILSRKKIEEPHFPDITGFRKGKLISPKLSRGSRREATYSQLYYPLALGEFKIPSFPVYVEDRKIFTDPLSGKVIEDSGISPAFQEVKFPVELISRLEPIDVYKGQAVKLDICLKLDEKYLNNFSFPDLEKIEQEIIAQLDDGAFDWEVIPKRMIKNISEKSSPEDQDLLSLCSIYLIPKKQGNIDLPAFQLQLRKKWLRKKGNNRKASEDYSIRYYPAEFISRISRLSVSSLPPTSLPLSATVGEFQIKDSLNKSNYFCGEPIRLFVEVSGIGNLRAVPRLRLKGPESFLIYDPLSRPELIPDHEALKGKKTFIYELVASQAGDYRIPPLSLYYFNPRKNSYDSTYSDSIYLSIQGEAIPQLLEINTLDNFYRIALKDSSNTPPYRIEGINSWILGASGAILILLLLSFFQPAYWFFGKNKQKAALSPGLKKLLQNKKA
ncbi:MAG: BatD family protein [Bacteroidia bacterium]|nr:BatD family protein [Bacteroidia bacterium]